MEGDLLLTTQVLLDFVGYQEIFPGTCRDIPDFAEIWILPKCWEDLNVWYLQPLFYPPKISIEPYNGVHSQLTIKMTPSLYCCMKHC